MSNENKPNNLQVSNADGKPCVMQCALEVMLGNNILTLNQEGIDSLNECWEDSGYDKWSILSIGVLNTLEICSEHHLIYRSAPLDWFDWHIA